MNKLGVPTEKHTVVFNGGTLNIDGGEETVQYTLTDKGLVKVDWEDNETEYWKIIEDVDGVLMLSTFNGTEEKALENMKVDLYASTDVSKIDTLFSHFVSVEQGQKIDPTTLKDKLLYLPTYWNGELQLQGLKILSDNTIQLYGLNLAYYLDNVVFDENMYAYNGSYEYKVSYPDGKIKIEGYNDSDDPEGYVYKYDLTGKTYRVADIWEDYGENFDQIKSAVEAEFGTNITFTSGAMYCPILWNQCWLDEDAINNIFHDRTVNN